MNMDSARAIALKELAALEPEIFVPVALCEYDTLETPLAWLFFYNSTEYIKTGKLSSRLAGNGPIVVMKSDGQTTSYGSMPPVSEILHSLGGKIESNQRPGDGEDRDLPCI